MMVRPGQSFLPLQLARQLLHANVREGARAASLQARGACHSRMAGRHHASGAAEEDAAARSGRND